MGVLEIREEEDGVIPVKPGTEDVPASSKQKWNVITVEIDSKSYHMFSIGDFVLTGEWTEETSTEKKKKRSLIVREQSSNEALEVMSNDEVDIKVFDTTNDEQLWT